MKLFDVADIELIHLQIIDASGGSHGARDRGRLAAVIATQTQEVFGKELYPTFHDKAAALARGIIADHPFFDGNKRTGIMLAIIFLENNGYRTVIDDKELEDFAVQIAVERLDVPAITLWLKERSKI